MSLIGAVIVACLLLTVPVNGSYYRRTVSYKKDVILRCYNKESPLVQTVMNFPSVDVWHMDTSSVDIMMSRRTARVVRRHLPRHCHVLISNVESHVRKAEYHMLSSDQRLKAWQINNGWDVTGQDIDNPNAQDWHNEYHNYESIVNWYQNLAKKHPNLVRWTNIGKTAENRDMIGVHITASKNPGRHRVYMQCLIHAREWISGAVCMYQAQMLVEGHHQNRILDRMEFVIVPVVNPDGYAYSWSNERLWRKNRAVNQGTNCRGVDLNRNFNTGWGEGEPTAAKVCSVTYHGAKAGSELEVQNVKKFFKKNGPIVAAIDFHSYGQLILRPFGWTKTPAKDEERLAAIGDQLQNLMPEYTSKKSIGLYKATGIASDWFYGDEAYRTNHGKRPASFTIELRDKGSHGFLLPADQILPTAKEARKALMYLATSAHETPLT